MGHRLHKANIPPPRIISNTPHVTVGDSLSRAKKREDRAPMPATAAGLLRFYEEESYGVKIRPEVVVIAVVVLILVVALAPILFP